MSESGNNFINDKMVTRYAPMAMLFLFIYIPVSFWGIGDPLSGWFQTFGLVVFIAAYLWYLKTKKTVILNHVLVFLGFPILMAWLITGGPEGIGLIWTGSYTIWVFLLCSQKWALRWLSIFALVMSITVFGSRIGYFPFSIAYSNSALLNILFHFLFVGVLVFIFSKVVDHYFKLFNEELQEKKTTEIKLMKMASIIQSSSEAIFSKSRLGIIQTWNLGAEKIFGYTAEEIIGQSSDLLIPENLKKETKELIQKVSSGNNLKSIDSKRITKDGRIIFVSVNFSPIFNENREVDSISIILRDITTQKELEEKSGKLAILEAKSKEMEEYSYIASHDLRHPLLTILSYTELFRDEYEDKVDDLGKKFLNNISNSAKRMDSLVCSLLDYTRLSKIKELESVNTQELMESIVTELDFVIQKKEASINFKRLPTIQAYPDELKQLLHNLITNALKFQKKGIRPEITVSAKSFDSEFQFSVKDNGIGMPEKYLAKIFVIFQRLHAEKKYEGIGAGLAFCKKIAEMHGGGIWVKSVEDYGSTFYFSIPKH